MAGKLMHCDFHDEYYMEDSTCRMCDQARRAKANADAHADDPIPPPPTKSKVSIFSKKALLHDMDELAHAIRHFQDSYRRVFSQDDEHLIQTALHLSVLEQSIRKELLEDGER